MRFEPTGFWLLTDHEATAIEDGEEMSTQQNIMVCPICFRIHWFENNTLKKTFILEKEL
jgi:hypothetical protein